MTSPASRGVNDYDENASYPVLIRCVSEPMRMWDARCGMRDTRCGMPDAGLWLLNLCCIIEPYTVCCVFGLSESADKKKNQGQDNTHNDAAREREIEAEIIPLDVDIAGKSADKRNPWAIYYNDSCYYQNNSCYKQKLTQWC